MQLLNDLFCAAWASNNSIIPQTWDQVRLEAEETVKGVIQSMDLFFEVTKLCLVSKWQLKWTE